MSKKLVCLAAVCLTLAVAGSASAQLGKGKVLFEYWDNIGGGTAVSDLTSNPLYPDHPTSSEWRDKFQSPSGRADNYGLRARAYLTPPADGDYTFWVAGDDYCELWLSTDDTAANATMICQVPGWTDVAVWNKYPEQQSAPVTLQAGKSYYIEGLMKEGGGGDSLDVGWAGPGIGDATTVIAGQYCTALIRDPEPLFLATKPDPANGAAEVTSPLFQWTPGITAVLHEVYMGTNPTPGAAEFMGPWPTNMYFHVMGLTPGATYYWRVDEVDAAGNKFPGNVWSFSVQPLEAHFPSPYDGAMWQRTDTTVSWTAGQGAVSHKVYGGEDQAAVAAGDAGALLATVKEAKLDASALLEPLKTYYWRVDEVDSTGKVTAGPVWSFSTVDPAGGAVAEYYDNMTLSGMPKVVKVEPEINFNWSGSTPGTGSPDAAIPIDGFSARWTAQLNVPVSGTYRIYEASDDGARTYLNGELICSGWADRGTTEDASADLELVAGESYVIVMEYYESGGGATAYLRWSGPGIAKSIIPQGALQLPQVAISPIPGNAAVEVPDSAVLGFTPGPKAVVHTLYFGTDQAKVAAGDASVALPPMAETTYVPPAPLAWNTTYYWKVDEMAPDGTTVPGLVWSFTTANAIVVNAGQAVLNYNNADAPNVSQLAFDVSGDLTRNGVTDLSLQFQGRVGPVVYNDATGSYKVTGGGADVWGSTDQFQYVYKTLDGDGSIVARVVDRGTGTNTWAKGGVMIRETLDADSKHMIVALTGGDGGGIAFQGRPTTGGNTSSFHGDVTAAPPYWVKLTREGDTFTAYYSADGVAWQPFTDTTPDNAGGPMSNPIQVTMAKTVLIGLAATSHDAATIRTFTFDNVSTTGGVTPDGPFSATASIGLDTAVNYPQPIYAAIEDAAGNVASVGFGDPAATQMTQLWSWKVPLSAFSGVDLTNAAKVYLGVGDLLNPAPGGSGVVTFSNVRIVKPVVIAPGTDVTQPGDNLIGVPNNGNWPGGEYPALAIDNKTSTKFLHFNGKTDPVGFQVEPQAGPTVVTGMTFTTANDAVERDPVAFDLYGSNDSIKGPWTLIASGDIVDFAGATAWPRYTKNTTPITFDNAVAYKYYQVLCTAVRNPAAANSMQISEVELLSVPPIIQSVVRANGTSGNRDPIGAFDGETQCLPTQDGGLKDGNLVYSDRTYPWNQTPAELVGAEYIRIFNTDKGAAGATYTVTLSRAATVAVAHDDRNTPWQDQVDMITAAFAAPGTFQDTGIDIFIYESASTPARPLSLFTADLEAGTYVFASEASGNTMYILGAIEKQ